MPFELLFTNLTDDVPPRPLDSLVGRLDRDDEVSPAYSCTWWTIPTLQVTDSLLSDVGHALHTPLRPKND